MHKLTPTLSKESVGQTLAAYIYQLLAYYLTIN